MLFRERHSEDYCAMYGICGKRTDGKVLNCPFGSPSVKVLDRVSYCCLSVNSALVEAAATHLVLLLLLRVLLLLYFYVSVYISMYMFQFIIQYI